MNPRFQLNNDRKAAAFTLIELLVVIAIIGVLSSLILGAAGLASRKMRDLRVQGELQNLILLIESYKQQTGFYPPDNSRDNYPGGLVEKEWARTAYNPLFYELSGAVFDGKTRHFRTLNQAESVSVANLNYLGVSTIANSAREKRNVPFRSASFKPSQYKEIWVGQAEVDLELLIVPVTGPKMIDARVNGKKAGKSINPWHYDASSTNRHNPNSFDIWAEYVVGSKTNTAGNWKD